MVMQLKYCMFLGVSVELSMMYAGSKNQLVKFVPTNLILSRSGPGPCPWSGPGQVSGWVQKVQGLRTKDLGLG